MLRRIRAVFVGIAAVVALGAALPVPQARACINDVLEEDDRKIRAIGRAERHLAAGRAAQAFRVAARARAMPSRGGLGGLALGARVERVMALATARLSGRVDLDRGRIARRASAAQRRENLEWALDVMDRAVAAQDLPVTRARRAEVMARIAGREEEAQRELEALAEADLMPDARAWAALASLRGRAGDAAGRTEALERCKTTAGPDARAICGETRRERARRSRDRS